MKMKPETMIAENRYLLRDGRRKHQIEIVFRTVQFNKTLKRKRFDQNISRDLIKRQRIQIGLGKKKLLLPSFLRHSCTIMRDSELFLLIKKQAKFTFFYTNPFSPRVGIPGWEYLVQRWSLLQSRRTNIPHRISEDRKSLFTAIVRLINNM